jgi:hypothetical protein
LVDWTIIRMQYEVFGEDIQTLADTYNVSEKLIEYTAEKQGWNVIPATNQPPKQWADNPNVEDEVLDEVNQRLRVIQTLRSQAINPQLIAMESALMTKAMEMIQSIDDQDVNASSKLKIASEILKTLREQNPTTQHQNDKNGDSGTGVRVYVLGAVGSDGQPAAGQVAVEIDSGRSVAPALPPGQAGTA